MFTQSKYRFLSKRSIRIFLGFVVVALVAGVYFLFRPFPAGPSLDVAAKVSGVKEAASVNGWSAYANPPAEAKANDSRSLSAAASSVQRLDIGAGYVLETSSKGSKIVAPSAPSVASASVKKLDIGAGYVLEISQSNSKIVAPNAPLVVSASVQRLDIGSGYVLETNAQGGRVIAPSASFVPAPAVAASATQTLYIGAGYVLETNAQGSRIVAPNTPLKLAATVSNAETLKKIDIGSGYTLLLGPGDSWKIAPAP